MSSGLAVPVPVVPESVPGIPDRPTLEGERALRGALGYIGRADAPGTRRAYAGDWRHFCAWCLQVGLAPLPATIAGYLDRFGSYPAVPAQRPDNRRFGLDVAKPRRTGILSEGRRGCLIPCSERR